MGAQMNTPPGNLSSKRPSLHPVAASKSVKMQQDAGPPDENSSDATLSTYDTAESEITPSSSLSAGSGIHYTLSCPLYCNSKWSRTIQALPAVQKQLAHQLPFRPN